MSNYKIPMRMCVACRQMYPKGELIRIVRTKLNDVELDKSHKMQGRGSYVCNKPECINKCVKSRLLNRSYKANISNEVYNKLQENNEK